MTDKELADRVSLVLGEMVVSHLEAAAAGRRVAAGLAELARLLREETGRPALRMVDRLDQ